MSTPGKVAFLQEAKRKGFQVELVFVTTRDPKINIARVANRAALGGHPVAADKVRMRYERAMSLLPSAIELADTADVFDNSGAGPLLVAMKRSTTLEFPNSDKAPSWVRDDLAETYRQRLESRLQMAPTPDHGANRRRIAITDADIRQGGTYTGAVIQTTSHHLLQAVAPAHHVLHDRALCPIGDVERDQVVTIAYRYAEGGKHVDSALGIGRARIPRRGRSR